MNKTSVTLQINGKSLILETGQLAKQATSSVLAKLGDTMVLSTVVLGKEREDLGYFPLTVDYIERLYAGGRIKGSRWVKREGRPSDDAILNGRLIDRSIRPLFPKEFKREVQVTVTILSVDGENEPDVLAMIAVSAALSASPIPWKGPIGATRIGYVKADGNEGEYLVNPGGPELLLSELDMVVSQTKEKTVMIEAGAKQVTEDIVLKAIEKATSENQKIIKLIDELSGKISPKKEPVNQNQLLNELILKVQKSYKDELSEMIKTQAKKESTKGLEEIASKVFEEEKMENPESEVSKKLVAEAVEKVFFKVIRENTLKKGQRPDSRKVDEIRSIFGEVSVLPRTHGSALFQRGDTQSLTVATLGSPRLEQLIESAEGEETKRYIHHYSMPPYSVGETGRIGTPSRREIGHGALAERAILPVIPQQDKFPYTIRVVSEILSSNGSTSMAATCGSTLALMDAGVPIERPVAGVAIGMVSDEEKYVLLTDILGIEDFSGDMDFKVAGTDKGITAIQLDVKNLGLTLKQIEETFEKAKTGRLFILGKIAEVIPSSRGEVSLYAPKIEVLHIPTEKIGEVIGPGGRIIRNIIAKTEATVDVEDDGSVTISGQSAESVKKAYDWINGLTREIKPGEIFEGTVMRLLPFGAFVEFLPGREGMVHVSQMGQGFVKSAGDVVKIGQKVRIRVMELDEQGRINLSMNIENKPREFQKDVSEHPLTKQFKRERDYSFRQQKGRGGFPKFKKPR